MERRDAIRALITRRRLPIGSMNMLLHGVES